MLGTASIVRSILSAAIPALLVGAAGAGSTIAQPPDVRIVPIPGATGYAESGVNVTAHRTDPLATHGTDQFVAFYDEDAWLILGKRTIGTSTWELRNTGLTAEISDAHRTAAIAVDGDGYLHLAWGHHNEPLNYVRSTAPGALTLTDRLTMPGIDPDTARLTYPEFFYLPDGNLLFTYRLGSSGKGDTYIQRYDRSTQTWTLLHDPTILGRTGDDVNAYPNGMVLDARGRFHWTWTWREDPAGPNANHDQLYARSPDWGDTWTRMDGTPYALPITEATAEIAWPIPQNSYIANQCDMTVDRAGRPMIAQYYDPGDGRRVMLTWYDGAAWQSSAVTGPIGWTRPLVVVDRFHRVHVVYVQGDTLRVATSSDPARSSWAHVDLADDVFGNDVTVDRKRLDDGDGQINLFYQRASDQSVHVLEWDPNSYDPPLPDPVERRSPLADTYVRDGVHAETNYGTADRLLVKQGTTDFTREAFLRFDVSGLATIADARLRLVPIAIGADGDTTEVAFELVENDAWDELATTWNTRPSGSGHVLAEHAGFATGEPITVDVTSDVLAESVTDGELSIRLSSLVAGGGRIVHFASREHSDVAYHPELILDEAANAGPGSIGASLRVREDASGALELSWSPSCSAGATGVGIYRGLLGEFGTHVAIDCFDDGADGRELVDALAANTYFLAVAHDPHAEGSYGVTSFGIERPRAAAPCRATQDLSPCP